MKKLTFFLLILLFYLVIIISAEEPVTDFSKVPWINHIEPDKMSVTSIDSGYNFDFKKSGAVEINGKNYMSAQENSYITTNKDGTITKADLTASADTTWNFDNKQYKVPEGGRLVYNNGKVEIYPSPKGPKSEFRITDTNNPQNSYGKFTLNEGSQLSISKEGVISGKNFEFEGMNIRGWFGEDGQIQKFSEGRYSLLRNSELQFKDSGLTIRTTTNPVAITRGNSFQTTGTEFSYQDGLNYRGRTSVGESFEIKDPNRNFNLLLQDGAEAYLTQNSLRLYTSKGGSAKLLTSIETIIEANGDVVNVKRGPVNIPFTEITVIPYAEQVTYFSNEGESYHAFYALSDPNKGPSVAYIADASFPESGISKLDDFGYSGKFGWVWKF
jgi:hypothetical protein